MTGSAMAGLFERLIARYGTTITHSHGANTYTVTAAVAVATNAQLGQYFPYSTYSGFVRPVRLVTIAGDYRQPDGSPALGDTLPLPDPTGAPGTLRSHTIQAIDRVAFRGVVVKTLLFVVPV